MKWTLAIAVACCVGIIPAVESPGFLLKNGNFDEPIDFEGGDTWKRFDSSGAVGQHDAANGAPGNPAYSQTGDGNFGLAFQTGQVESGGFYQDVPVEAGRSYDFSIQSHHGCNSFGTNGTHVSELVFNWYDGVPDAGGAVISSSTHSVAPGSPGGCDDGFPNAEIDFDWSNWSFSGNVAPAGAAYLRLVLYWNNGGTSADGSNWIRWDNAVLTTAVDPFTPTVGAAQGLSVTYNTQSGLTYVVESAPDLLSGFGDAGLPLVVGDDATQQVTVLPTEPNNAYRLESGGNPH